MGASPDVLLVPSAVHVVKGEVRRNSAEVGAFSWLAVEVPKLPANHIGVLMAPVVVTDRLAVDHYVAFPRSLSPNQCDWYIRQALSSEITSLEAKLWAGSARSSVDAAAEALVGNGSMEDVVEQGVGDAAHHLLSATLLVDGRGLRLNHSYGEEEEGFAKLGEKHFLAGGGG